MERGQAFAFLVVLPIIIIIVWGVSFAESFNPTGEILFFRLPVCYWYYRILTTIKAQLRISKTQQFLVSLFIVVFGVMPLISFVVPNSSYLETSLFVVYVIIAVTGLTILTLQFEKVLEGRKIKIDRLTGFIYMSVYPIGIYNYWDLTKT